MNWTLQVLRDRFWWLGPDHGSYIVALNKDEVEIRVIQPRWNRSTLRYEAVMEREFSELRLRVMWYPFYSDAIETTIAKEKEKATRAGLPFDRNEFVLRMQRAEGKR
ncbi:MAG: hypothetical protein SGI86_11730 [Deltaproteobacteria bacterium]|nr:hypothetical protein [Deltaproteobacteria bacterium]